MKKQVFYFIVSIATIACQNEKIQQHQLVGYAQGTTFQIRYIAQPKVNYETSFDSLFKIVDQSMSIYNRNSFISALNRGDSNFIPDPVFRTIWQRAFEIAEETGGSFDPTVEPLVNLWGSGPELKKMVDSATVDSILNYVGYQKVQYSNDTIVLPYAYTLNFNAIAQGHTVDLIAKFLESEKVKHYMIEIGGEIKTKGQNIDGKTWRIGIHKPNKEIDESHPFQTIIALKDAALATSGNYRKFWVCEESGIKYSHIINPKTGFPIWNHLLSVSVISSSCMDADAYATACMVMGTKRATQFIENKKELEAYLVYTDEDGKWKTYITKGFSKYIQ